ncbi:MAG TPA: tetratricopeptide repeat protein [Thermoplasmata archaeon]|nr:tetratricopeptide repeat protein [Thermoplasmata archaeon]
MTQQFDLGMHHFLREEWRQAVHAFQEVLREEPHDGRAWSYLGMSLAHLGQGPAAEAALSRAIAISPTDGESWFHLGVARSLRSEWSAAASAYRRAVALIPEDMVAWHRLGVALAECGERDASTAAFERALVLSRETGAPVPETPLTTSGNPADHHLGEAGEREDSRELESWLNLALSLLSLGDEEEAVAAYERAYLIDPERAQRSLFRPMLRLLTVAEGRPVEDEGPAMDSAVAAARPTPPTRRPRPDEPGPRPEVA